jgi:hypothetical protein
MKNFIFFFFISRQETNSATLNHFNEEIYNKNMLKSIKNVQTAADLCGSNAFTAVKITAFVPPDVLQKLNQIVEQQQSSTELSILELASNASTVNDVYFPSFRNTFL